MLFDPASAAPLGRGESAAGLGRSNMAAPLRIARLSLTHRLDADDPAKDYVGRLVLLIPGEIIALYQAGRAAIIHQFATPPSDWSPSVISERGAWIGWTLFCLV